MNIPLLDGLGAIAGDFDGFILDLWGVLHDGVRTYPGAVDCLERLAAAGKPVVILSNAPRRAAPVAKRLAEIGVGDGLYRSLLTSGEAAWQFLKARSDPFHAGLGRNCLEIAADETLLDGLDFDKVSTVDAADFLLAIGVRGFDETVDTYAGLLADAANRRLPFVCVNPDRTVIYGGRPFVCAGALAARYKELGGKVRYHGKPHPQVYGMALERLGLDVGARVLAVGDSLHTDIAGARGAGLGSVLVTGGIHHDALGIAPGEKPAPDRLEALYIAEGMRPDTALPAFVW